MPAMAGIHPLAQKLKVFCFFSSEKKNFLCCGSKRLKIRFTILSFLVAPETTLFNRYDR